MRENKAWLSLTFPLSRDGEEFMASYDPSEGINNMRITALIAASVAALALAACTPADKAEDASADAAAAADTATDAAATADAAAADATAAAATADAAAAPAADAAMAPAADAAAPAA